MVALLSARPNLSDAKAFLLRVPYKLLKFQEFPMKARFLALRGAISRLVFLGINVLIGR
jgi:hypothetical protein